MTWRQIAAELGRSIGWCHGRFYELLSRIEPPEIEQMRAEENFKLDEREQRALVVYGAAMTGTPLRHNGSIVYEERDGEPYAVMERRLDSAIAALREMDRVGLARMKLNGLAAPIKVIIEEVGTPAAEMATALDAYLQGLDDATAGYRGDVAGAAPAGSDS